MDSIINKLTEIENAASAIVEHTEVEKEKLDQEYAQKRKAFDEKLEAETNTKLRKIREELEITTKQLLDSRAGANTDSVEALQEEFDTRHTLYAQEILRRITEV